MTTSLERSAGLAAQAAMGQVLAAPAADAPRLAFADAIEGEDPARAALVRAQCAQAGLELGAPAWDLGVRAENLLRPHSAGHGPGVFDDDPERSLHADCSGLGGDWVPETVRRAALACSIRRGFADGLLIEAEQLVAHAAAIFDAAPITHLAIPRLRTLGPRDVGAPAQLDALRAVLALPQLSRVTSLAFHGFDMGDAGAALLAESTGLGAVARLDLTGNRLTPADVSALAASPAIAQLRTLVLAENSALRAPGVEAIGRARWAASLRTLDLRKCGLGGKGVAALLSLPLELTALSLAENQIGGDGLRGLGGAAWAPGLRALSVRGNPLLGSNCAAALGASPLTGVAHLDVASTRLGPGEIGALATSPLFDDLRTLEVSGNHGLCDDDVAKVFAGRAALRRLVADQCLQLGDGMWKAIAASPRAERLMWVVGSGATDAGAACLAASEHLGDLRWLDLCRSKLGGEAVRAILRSPGLRALDFFRAEGHWEDRRAARSA